MQYRRRVRVIGTLALVTIAVTVFGAGVAGAHVLVQPGSLRKGASDVIFSFSAPNETTTNSNFTQLEVDFPLNHPLLSAYALTQAGWTATVESSKLAKPVKTDDGTITEAVSKITWTAAPGGGVPPDQFGLFSILVGQLPSDTATLTFKAIQTYSDGTTVSWIEPTVKGAPAPDHPTPVLKLTGKAPKG